MRCVRKETTDDMPSGWIPGTMMLYCWEMEWCGCAAERTRAKAPDGWCHCGWAFAVMEACSRRWPAEAASCALNPAVKLISRARNQLEGTYSGAASLLPQATAVNTPASRKRPARSDHHPSGAFALRAPSAAHPPPSISQQYHISCQNSPGMAMYPSFPFSAFSCITLPSNQRTCHSLVHCRYKRSRRFSPYAAPICGPSPNSHATAPARKKPTASPPHTPRQRRSLLNHRTHHFAIQNIA